MSAASASEAAQSLRRNWLAFCDADPLDPPDLDRVTFAEAMEAAGLATFRRVTATDLAADPFAAERGIEPGGYLWALTPAGWAALAEGRAA